MGQNGYLLGLDIGSSSIKAALLDTDTGALIASATSPKTEMEIFVENPGWAEQHPDLWWNHIKTAIQELRSTAGVDFHAVRAIGIAYQMHGLVMVDKNHEPLMNSIIWCDSRAVGIGEEAFGALGREYCLKNYLNSPGNFTASKLKWVQLNKPELYKKIYKIMLPGDYIAMKLTGEITTTPSGLSEGIMWDYSRNELAQSILDYYGISKELIPETVPTFSTQGLLLAPVAQELGLTTGIPITYRAGDQPNNAFSLNVLNPGEIASTAGTSGVVYGVTDSTQYDPACRVNTFVHVNNTSAASRYGILLCVNGTGICNRWLRSIAGNVSYAQMNEAAGKINPGSNGLIILPYGNGAERTLENREIGASIHGLDFSTHSSAHLFRAAQEGIVFALRYGLDVMRSMGVEIKVVRAGYANMFQSPVFAGAFSTICGARLELYNTDGAQGAARGAGLGAKIYASAGDAFSGLTMLNSYEPDEHQSSIYEDTYARWVATLHNEINRNNQ